jgi:hypothetical protein
MLLSKPLRGALSGNGVGDRIGQHRIPQGSGAPRTARLTEASANGAAAAAAARPRGGCAGAAAAGRKFGLSILLSTVYIFR